MDNGYGDHSLHNWNRPPYPTGANQNGHSYAASGHPSYHNHTTYPHPNVPTSSSSLGQMSGFPILAHPTTMPPNATHFPGPPVSSGPQYPMHANSFSPYQHQPHSSSTQPDFEPGHYHGLPMPQYHTMSHLQLQQRIATPPQDHLQVVGQQGRRGILPCASGRPPAAVAKNSSTLNKDENGKFPCQHCAKTYQHAKHLKRHMLRHTGDRPYSCRLCQETFSRSDILKRHFLKCSQRKGIVPDETSHLVGSQSNLRKNRASKAEDDGALTSSSAPPTPYEAHYGGGQWTNIAPFSDQPYTTSLPPLASAHSRSSSVAISPNDPTRDSRQHSFASIESQSSGKFDYLPHHPAPTEPDHGLTGYPVHQGQPFYEQRR